jgi:hypothetical protein
VLVASPAVPLDADEPAEPSELVPPEVVEPVELCRLEVGPVELVAPGRSSCAA